MPKIKVGIYGKTGSGKSTIGATAYLTDPSAVFVLMLERQAESIVSLHNPDAMLFTADSLADVRVFVEFCRLGFATGFFHRPTQVGSRVEFTPTETPFTCETIVVDSVSDLFRMATDEIRTARAEKVKDALAAEVLDMQGWGVLQTRVMGVLRALRDLPSNLLCIFSEEVKDENGKTVRRPFIQGNDLKSNLVGLFNAFGYAQIRPDENGRPIREVMFFADDRYSVKPLSGMSTLESPEFRVWHGKFLDAMKRKDDER